MGIGAWAAGAAWLFGCARPASVDRLAPADPALAAPIAPDPRVVTGQLPNGASWAVRASGGGTVALRLALEVGSVLEADDQRGAVHLLEHLALAAEPEHGPHQAVHAGFDETVYRLTVPAEALRDGLRRLRAWALAPPLDDAAVEAHRHAVLREWRHGLGASSRLQQATVPATFFGSPYAERLPIGTEAGVAALDADAVRTFHRTWHRPDLLRVVAVGDLDPADAAAAIAQVFGGDVAPDGAPARPTFEVPGHADARVVTIVDPAATRAAVAVAHKRDGAEPRTVGELRASLVEAVGLAVVNERLAELARQPGGPVAGAGAGVQRLTRTEVASGVTAVARGGVLDAYRALLREIRRLREHGLRAPEVERARARLLAAYHGLRADPAVDAPDAAADELVRAFTLDEPTPGVDAEVALALRLLPGIAGAELDRWVAAWMAEDSRVVTVIQPEGADPVDADALRRVAEQVAAEPIAPPPDERPVAALVAALPPPGEVVATDLRYADALGFTGWTLSNGVRVWFRRTPFAPGEVRLTAFSPGGASALSDDGALAAELALEVAADSGLGALDATALDRWLAGRRATLGRGLSEGAETFGGVAARDDLEALLLQVWAAVAAPRFAPDALARAVERRKALLAARAADPVATLHDVWLGAVWPGDVRRHPASPAALDAVDLDAVRAAYVDRFGDAGDFTFVLVGDLPEPDALRALVVRTLGALPATRRIDAPRDRGVRPVSGAISVDRPGPGELGAARLQWRGPFRSADWDARHGLYVLGAVLDATLRDRLGDVPFAVTIAEAEPPEGRYTVTVELAAGPERLDDALAEVEATVRTLREAGPPAELVVQERARAREAYLRGRTDDTFWLAAFAGALQRGADPLGLLGWEARDDALSVDAVRGWARAWLDDRQRVRIVVRPAPPTPGDTRP